jgi:hypothetical protein
MVRLSLTRDSLFVLHEVFRFLSKDLCSLNKRRVNVVKMLKPNKFVSAIEKYHAYRMLSSAICMQQA